MKIGICLVAQTALSAVSQVGNLRPRLSETTVQIVHDGLLFNLI